MTGELEVGDGAGVGEDLEVGDGVDLHGTEGACVEEEVISKDEQRRRRPLRRTAKPLAGGDHSRRPDLGFATGGAGKRRLRGDPVGGGGASEMRAARVDLRSRQRRRCWGCAGGGGGVGGIGKKWHLGGARERLMGAYILVF
jgi:hypothetical protein